MLGTYAGSWSRAGRSPKRKGHRYPGWRCTNVTQREGVTHRPASTGREMRRTHTHTHNDALAGPVRSGPAGLVVGLRLGHTKPKRPPLSTARPRRYAARSLNRSIAQSRFLVTLTVEVLMPSVPKLHVRTHPPESSDVGGRPSESALVQDQVLLLLDTPGLAWN